MCAHLESLSSVNFTFQTFKVLFQHIFAPLLSRKSESATIEQLFNCNLYWAQIWKCGNQDCDSKTDQLWSQIREMNTHGSYSRLTRVYNTPFVSPLGEGNTCFILSFWNKKSVYFCTILVDFKESLPMWRSLSLSMKYTCSVSSCWTSKISQGIGISSGKFRDHNEKLITDLPAFYQKSFINKSEYCCIWVS